MLPLSFVGAPLEMTKRRWKESMQALYENHFDPRKDEELKQSKIEIENKLPKILKLVKERRQNRRNRNTEANLRKESELIELIEDFHKHYQFVYTQYDHLKGQLSQTVNGTKEDEGYFTATSSSDSESEKDVGSDDSHPNNGFKNHQHEVDQELDELKQKLTHLAQEKESSNVEQMEVMNKAEEGDKMLQKLDEESRELKGQLGEKEQKLSSFARMYRLHQNEASNLINELESELSSLNIKLGSFCTEKQVLGDQQVENRKSQDQVLHLEKIEKELLTLANGIEGVENGSVSEVSKIKGLMTQINNLTLNVDCLNANKGDSREQKAHQSNNNNDSTLHENLSDQVNKMKRDLGSMRKKNTDLESKLKKKARESSDFLSQIENLKKELASKTLDLQKIQKEKDDSVARTKSLELELQNLRSQKGELDKQMARKDRENNELKREVKSLQGKMAKTESSLKEREDQFSALQKKLENGEEGKSAEIVALTTQINHLEKELELSNELERQINVKNQDINKLIEDKELLRGKILEVEKRLEDRGGEFSNLQNQMSSQIVALTREISQLQQETDMKRKLDEQISSQDKEITQLGEERENLQAKTLELEITLTEREDQIAALQRKLHIGENEKSGLSAQISYLQKELNAEKRQSQDRLTQLESQNNELTSKISSQQLILKQQEDTMNKLREECKLVKGRFLQVADRKMDEVAGEFRKNFEDKLRILSQRIRVAEQLHVENKENCKKLQERCEQEHPGLEKKLSDLISSSKDELWRVSEALEEMMKGMENVVSDLESKEGSFVDRISRVSEEIQVAKNWVRWTIDEMKPWKNEPPSSPFAVPVDEQDRVMKEKVKRLEAKVNKEKSDKLRLMRGAYELQKKVADLEKIIVEKDQGLSILGKEKIEAIRQLCMSIDYHQSKVDHLKEIVLVKRIKSQGRR